MENHLSVVHPRLFNIFTATFRIGRPCPASASWRSSLPKGQIGFHFSRQLHIHDIVLRETGTYIDCIQWWLEHAEQRRSTSEQLIKKYVLCCIEASDGGISKSPGRVLSILTYGRPAARPKWQPSRWGVACCAKCNSGKSFWKSLRIEYWDYKRTCVGLHHTAVLLLPAMTGAL
jgi:hypothetical protein